MTTSSTPDTSQPISPEQYGRIAYEAYYHTVGGFSVNGEYLPTWDEVAERSPNVKDAWVRASQTVRATALRRFADYLDGTGFVASIKPSTIAEMAREEAGE